VTRTILLTVQFDGTDYAGWQHQPDQRTVQGTLADALRQMVHHEVVLLGTSRTDAGVHAQALPVSFATPREAIPLRGFVGGLNSLLPPDLAILGAREVPMGFRPRDEAVAKTYTYRYQIGPRRPLVNRYAWAVRRQHLDLDAMRAGAAQLVGDHDFDAFRSAQCQSRTTRRTLYSLTLRGPDDDGVIALVITGNAFLRNMVRIIAGTLFEAGTGRRSPHAVGEVLAARDRTLAGPTAPGCGLTLTEVHFQGYPRLGKPARPPVGEDA